MARKLWISALAMLISGGLAVRATSADTQSKDDHDHGHEHKHGDGHGHDHDGGHEHKHGDGDKGYGQMDKATMEKMMQEFGRPGPEHELLKGMAGKWKTKMISYWENPEEPGVAEGVSDIKLIMDGRFAVESYKSDYNGMPFEGMGITGYDKVKKKYVGTWMDNMGTGVMHSEGTYDEASKTLTLFGEADSPMGHMKMRMTAQQVDANKTIFTMYTTMPGMPQEMKGMEIIYTRM